MNKTTILLLGVFVLLQSCSSDDLPTDQFDKARNGAYLRTIGFENAALVSQDPDSRFEVTLDIFDKKRGDFFERVEVYLSYEDFSPENGDVSTTERMFEAYSPSDFNRNVSELPRVNLDYSLGELSSAIGIPIDQVSCNDEFVIRLNIVLKDGNSFSVGQNSGSIIYFESFSKSPFRYRIPIIEPIDESLFTGQYLVRSIEGTSFELDFNNDIENSNIVVNVIGTHTPNFRRTQIGNTLIEFRILCDQIRVTEYLAECYRCEHFNDIPLYGPSVANAPINPLDDSAFEIWMDLGYEGYGPFVPTKIQLIKQ